MCMRAVDVLLCHYNVLLSRQSYDMLYSVRPRKHTRLTRPFPWWILGTRLTGGSEFRITSLVIHHVSFTHGSCGKNGREITSSEREGGNRRNVKKRVTTQTLTGSVKEMIWPSRMIAVEKSMTDRLAYKQWWKKRSSEGKREKLGGIAIHVPIYYVHNITHHFWCTSSLELQWQQL